MADYTLSDIKARGSTVGLVEGTGYTQDAVSLALSQYMTLGTGINEVSTSYEYAKGFHHIKLLDRVSPEVMLVFMSQMVGFHVKTRSGNKIQTTERALKKSMLKTADLI